MIYIVPILFILTFILGFILGIWFLTYIEKRIDQISRKEDCAAVQDEHAPLPLNPNTLNDDLIKEWQFGGNTDE